MIDEEKGRQEEVEVLIDEEKGRQEEEEEEEWRTSSTKISLAM